MTAPTRKPAQVAPVFTASIRKNVREEIRVSVEMFNGRYIASIREWFSAPDGTMRPGNAT